MAQLKRRTTIKPHKHHAYILQNVETLPILLSIDMTELQAHSFIRIGMGRFAPKQKINYAVDVIIMVVTNIKNMSKM